MNESIDRAVNRVIETMYERVGEELTVDDLARTAMYSKFHFSRAFRKVTGVSPGRFLSALRFQEAKRLLADTSLSVAEISNQVGYSSLGTFSTRFKRYVGVSPTEYRRRGAACPSPGWAAEPQPDRLRVTIRGEVTAAVEGDCGHVFVGLFPGPVPQGSPVRFTMLSCPGPYELADVPEGTWYLLAQGVIRNGIEAGGDPPTPVGSVGRLGPITIRPSAPVSLVDVRLRLMRTVDLPVVSAPFVTRPGTVGRRELAGAGAGGPARSC